MLIEAVSQVTEGSVYTLSGNDDLHVGVGVTIQCTYADTIAGTGADAVIAWSGAHVITVDGTIIGEDEAINLIGCVDAQTVIINATGSLVSGGDGIVRNADGVILDGIGSTLTNAGTITSWGSAVMVFVRDAGTTTVTNSGTMSGDVAGVWAQYGQGVLVFQNSGTVTSPNQAFLGGLGIDLVTNTGLLDGDVMLMASDDLYDGQNGGQVTGSIDGGEGNDTFRLGSTQDTVLGGAGVDVLDYAGWAQNGVIIDLTGATANRGGALGDSYSGIEVILGGKRTDTFIGDGADNLFTGGNGADQLNGGAGNDTLQGDVAKDVLTGGTGSDDFLFLNSSTKGDLITDFTSGEDNLVFEGSAFGYGTATGAVSAADFCISTTNAALDASDRFIFNTTDTTLWYDRDGTGFRAAVLICDLQSGAALTADDLWLI